MKNKPIKIGSYFFEKIFDSKIIKAGIQKVAKKISDDYRNSEPPILLFVTNGGMFLGVDLSRELEKNNLSCAIA